MTSALTRPRFEARAGIGGNPVYLLLTFAWYLGLGLFIGLLLGCPAGMMAGASDVPELAIVVAILTLACVLVFAIVKTLAVESGKVTFHDAGFFVTWRPRRGERFEGRVPYSAISHLGLVSAVQVQLRFVFPERRRPYTVLLPIRQLDGEDFFDYLVEYLEGAGLRQVYSIYEHGEVRHSRPWDFADLQPEAPLVTFSGIDRRDSGSGYAVRVGDRELLLTESEWSRRVLTDPASGALVAVANHDRLFDPRGCVLATMRRSESGQQLIECGSGLVLVRRREGDGVVLVREGDGEAVARGARVGSLSTLTFTAPTHELWAALLLLAATRFRSEPSPVRRHARHVTGRWIRAVGSE